jgi:hypothetical protein
MIGRIRIDGTGNLIFTKLIASDEGRYQCTAQNAVATRETAAVLLSVHGTYSHPSSHKISVDNGMPLRTRIDPGL